MQSSYNPNPYHNSNHASDVTSSILFFLFNSAVLKELSDLDNLSIVVAALCHDVGHPGVNNRFLVNNKKPIAMTYNDISVLENMHSSVTFEIMTDQDKNLLATLSAENRVYVRKLIIEMILETDMSKHFDSLGKFIARTLNAEDFKLSNIDDKIMLLKIGLNIGHSAKEWGLHYNWSMKVVEEFYHQGDLERDKGQIISMYCDRHTTDINKSQGGFLKAICLPLYEAFSSYLHSESINNFCVNSLKSNILA